MGFDVERDGLAELRRQADQLAARLGNAMRADVTYIGEDPSGAVRVTVDGAGRVVDVRLGDSGPTADRLGDAVLTAIEDATACRLRSWAEAVAAHETGDVPPRPPSPAADPVRTDDLLDLLRRVDGQLDAFAEAAGREVSTHGPVTVTLRGGQVVGVRLDRQWFATASRSRITTELKAAFDEAYRMIDDTPPPGPLAELQAMTADFDTLLRSLDIPGK